MRNLFDQYKHPENRLSHALAVCLNEDRALLRKFLAMVGVKPSIKPAKLIITEQSLPGDPPDADVEDERKGLPDIIIHDDKKWCLLIESKVEAALTHDQLERHERTLDRREFENVHMLAITKSDVRLPRGAIGLTWPQLYEWLGKGAQRSPWPNRLRDYLRAAELRMIQQDKTFTEGTLTRFDGFPFNDDNPYTYGEAKRRLKLALEELRKDRSLCKLGMDPNGPGRPALTGRKSPAIWDFIPLVGWKKHGGFTGFPHLTLGVHIDHLEAAITVPHRVARPIREQLASFGAKRMIEMNRRIIQLARPLIARGARLKAYALQRHYLSQNSPPITDAELSFRLETSLPRRIGDVKLQEDWVKLFADLPGAKRSNIQFQYRVQYFWGETKGLDTRESLKLIADGWKAMKPLLDALRGES